MEHLKSPVTISGPAFTETPNVTLACTRLEFSCLNFTGLPAIQLRNLALCRNGIGEIYQQNARRTAAGYPPRS